MRCPSPRQHPPPASPASAEPLTLHPELRISANISCTSYIFAAQAHDPGHIHRAVKPRHVPVLISIDLSPVQLLLDHQNCNQSCDSGRSCSCTTLFLLSAMHWDLHCELAYIFCPSSFCLEPDRPMNPSYQDDCLMCQRRLERTDGVLGVLQLYPQPPGFGALSLMARHRPLMALKSSPSSALYPPATRLPCCLHTSQTPANRQQPHQQVYTDTWSLSLWRI